MTKTTWLWGPRFGPQLERAISYLSGPQDHVAVDGGALVRPNLPNEAIANWLAIGDGDSGASPEMLDKIYAQDKDVSDLTLALAQIGPMTKYIRAIGFSGGRPDHQMIVFGRFWHHLKQYPQQINLDHHWLLLSEGNWCGQLQAGTCSLITLESVTLTLNGDWRWPLESYQTQILDDRLLSNQVGSKDLQLRCDAPVFLWSEKPIHTFWQES